MVQVRIDFELLRKLIDVAESYALAHCHGEHSMDIPIEDAEIIDRAKELIKTSDKRAGASQ